MTAEQSGINNSPLPDTRHWQPRASKSETLEHAFFIRCQQIERGILRSVADEVAMNFDNFDSGLPIEDLVRKGLRELLPGRYSVTSGIATDSLGYTAGDCDIIIFNDEWFPIIKQGATLESRRRFIPVDGAYAVFEVKQSLGPKSLDRAMQKLVTCKRLYRPKAPGNRMVENSELSSCNHFTRNPLFAGVVAVSIQDGVGRDELITRFVRINQTLPRRDVINSLCILGATTVLWGYYHSDTDAHTAQYGNLKPALFMREDLYAELLPVMCGDHKDGSPLFELIRYLLAHLYHSVLAPEDIAVQYGLKDNEIRVPTDSQYRLSIDPLLFYQANAFWRHAREEDEKYR